MSFLSDIEKEVKLLTAELERARVAKFDKTHHARFVSNEINNLVKEDSSKNPDSPVVVLGGVLSKVPDLILKSFNHIDSVEQNIIVTINSYNRVKDMYIAYENRKKQEADQVEEKKRKTRNVGEKPEDKLKQRRKKSKKSETKRAKDKTS